MSLIKKKRKSPQEPTQADYPMRPGSPNSNSVKGSVAMTIAKYEEALEATQRENSELLATIAELQGQRDREGVIGSRIDVVKTLLDENKILVQRLTEALYKVEKEQVLEITMLRRESELQRQMLERLVGNSSSKQSQSIWDRIGGSKG
jgi:hypothetical protein